MPIDKISAAYEKILKLFAQFVSILQMKNIEYIFGTDIDILLLAAYLDRETFILVPSINKMFYIQDLVIKARTTDSTADTLAEDYFSDKYKESHHTVLKSLLKEAGIEYDKEIELFLELNNI